MTKAFYMDMGHLQYGPASDLQNSLFNEKLQDKQNGLIPDNHLIFCEHNHVYTLGKNGVPDNLLANPAFLDKIGAEVYETQRGGDITYHGPGQLIAYPIFDLQQMNLGVKEYVWKVEECIIQTLANYDIEGERIEGRIGIWVGKDTDEERKIAAIGIKCSRYVTMHGLALNVNTDLSYFDYIVPCGIIGKSVTSMKKELGREIDISDVKNDLRSKFKTIFELDFTI
ncbi:MAG: lipoyl(octanoyl) transferase LipB [Bacteroidia bacterium]|nr:lipoyl(octanoyl) transferase LipB [Bacteroidia bacterium]